VGKCRRTDVNTGFINIFVHVAKKYKIKIKMGTSIVGFFALLSILNMHSLNHRYT
jgi:hypothetical protein